MLVLGIETSCDETAAAVVEDGRRILSNVVATQVPFHRIYSGVVPEVASRKHAEWILPVVKQSLKEAGVTLSDIDAVAQANRPGLIGALLVGLTFAKTLAWAEDKPFIAVNHMKAHLYASRLDWEGKNEASVEYPFIGLLVSGGHTIIALVNDFYDMEVLGTTIDDSIGEAFDKVAKALDLGYPGGVVIDRLSKDADSSAYSFPLPHIGRGKDNTYDVSYSGLKTAVIHQREMFLQKGHTANTLNLCASFQEAAVKTLVDKVFRAVDDTQLHTVVAGGGVAANSRLRSMLSERKDIHCIFPPLKLCGDNGAMVAGVAYPLLERGERSGLETTAQARIPQFKRRY